MSQPIIFRVMSYLETACPLAGIPTPSIEWLSPTGTSSSVVQLDEPTVEKSYINGSKQYRVGLDLVLQGEVLNKVGLIDNMHTYVGLFEALKGQTLTDVEIIRVETTTPSLRAQTENMVVRYGSSVTIVYRSNE